MPSTWWRHWVNPLKEWTQWSHRIVSYDEPTQHKLTHKPFSWNNIKTLHRIPTNRFFLLFVFLDIDNNRRNELYPVKTKCHTYWHSMSNLTQNSDFTEFGSVLLQCSALSHWISVHMSFCFYRVWKSGKIAFWKNLRSSVNMIKLYSYNYFACKMLIFYFSYRYWWNRICCSLSALFRTTYFLFNSDSTQSIAWKTIVNILWILA